MTVTAQQVTRFNFTLMVLVKEGLGYTDKATHIHDFCRCIAVIKIKRAARLQCHTTRTSKTFTTTHFLGVNDSLAIDSVFLFLGTPFSVGFQSVAPAA